MKIKGTEVGTGRPLICVPVLEKTKEEVIKEVEYLVKSDADMIEWRLDAFEHYTDYNEVREILQQIAPLLKKKLFLYTFRTAKQGGVVSVDRETLNDLHDLAAESECVDLIDLEFFEEEHPARKIRKLHLRVPHDVSIDYGCSIRGNNSLGSDGDTFNFFGFILTIQNKCLYIFCE